MTVGGRYGGIDIGASASKAVIIDGARKIVAAEVRRTSVSFETSAREVMDAALAAAGLRLEEVGRLVATGYGRHNVDFAHATRTEIACHARAAHFSPPRRITVVDIGGQDNKIIHVNAQGRRESFKMNRKCAAGTGAFLEEVAQRMDVPLERIDGLARRAEHTVQMGSYCTVFTKTEILAHMRAGEKVPEIVAGLVESVVKRILEMDPLAREVVLTGGVVAHIPILAEMLAARVRHPVHVVPDAQFAGAFGAALMAAEME